MENEVLNVIRTRRSCRKYKPEQITDEELQAVLEAGTYAPSSRGMQSAYIVAVQNKEQQERLASMNARIMGATSNPYYDAPTYVLVFAPANANNPVQDGSCILENMMLAAHSLGLGSCWIHREREMFASPEGQELMCQWGLPAWSVSEPCHWAILLLKPDRRSLARKIISALSNKPFFRRRWKRVPVKQGIPLLFPLPKVLRVELECGICCSGRYTKKPYHAFWGKSDTAFFVCIHLLLLLLRLSRCFSGSILKVSLLSGGRLKLFYFCALRLRGKSASSSL